MKAATPVAEKNDQFVCSREKQTSTRTDLDSVKGPGSPVFAPEDVHFRLIAMIGLSFKGRTKKGLTMTEAELLDAASYQFELVMSTLALYITVTSAYLLVAFVAGIRLTESQTIIISTLYIVISSLATYAVYSWTARGVYYAIQLEALDPNVPEYSKILVPSILPLLLAGGVFASLKFMWDVRHPKTK